MTLPSLIHDLESTLTGCELKLCEPLSRHSTFRTGGICHVMVVPLSSAGVASAVRAFAALSADFLILGGGSNMLFPDSGISLPVLKVGRSLCDFRIDGDTIECGAGISPARLNALCAANGISGFEPLSGIPGTLGGAVWMNAGAFGSSFSDFVISVSSISPEGDPVPHQAAELAFAYRSSLFQTSLSGHTITGVRLAVRQRADREIIVQRTGGFAVARRNRQPAGYSCGSFFKNPPGAIPAAVLIERSGLKGFSIGGAKVSEKHANFIVNYNNATTSDILAIADHVMSQVWKHSAVMLEPEVRIISG